MDEVIHKARNARTHSDEQVALIAGAIREFGFANPILVDGGSGVIAGHGPLLAARRGAARRLELETVPVIELAHLSEAQQRANVLADNKPAERAGWDAALLALEAAELDALGVDLGSRPPKGRRPSVRPWQARQTCRAGPSAAIRRHGRRAPPRFTSTDNCHRIDDPGARCRSSVAA